MTCKPILKFKSSDWWKEIGLRFVENRLARTDSYEIEVHRYKSKVSSEYFIVSEVKSRDEEPLVTIYECTDIDSALQLEHQLLHEGLFETE